MVGDALEVLGDHEVVKDTVDILLLIGVEVFDETQLHLVEIVVHGVVAVDDHAGQVFVLLDVGVDRPAQHVLCRPCHGQKVRVFHHLRLYIVLLHDFRDVVRIVADPLQVGNQLAGGRNRAEIRSHRLLLQKELEAEVFYVPLLLGDLLDFPRDVLFPVHGLGQQIVDGFLYGLDTLLPHGNYIFVQLVQLCFVCRSHLSEPPYISHFHLHKPAPGRHCRKTAPMHTFMQCHIHPNLPVM